MKMKLLLVLLFGVSLAGHADLIVNIDAPKTVGQKTVVKLDLNNTFSEKIESARAVAFLLDEHGKMVGESSKWVIGGAKGSPALESGKETTFNFVLQSHESIASTNLTAKVSFSRVMLEGGKQADINKTVQIKNAKASGNQ